MSNKLLLKYLSVFVFIGIVIFSGYRIYKGTQPEELFMFNEKNKVNEKTNEKNNEEKEKEYIILIKESYNNSYRTTKILYQTGRMEQSTIKDNTTSFESEKETFVQIGNVTEEDLTSIKDIISRFSNQPFKKENYSNSFGILVRLKETDQILYSVEYFDQENINELNNIINKY